MFGTVFFCQKSLFRRVVPSQLSAKGLPLFLKDYILQFSISEGINCKTRCSIILLKTDSWGQTLRICISLHIIAQTVGTRIKYIFLSDFKLTNSQLLSQLATWHLWSDLNDTVFIPSSPKTNFKVNAKHRNFLLQITNGSLQKFRHQSK